MHCLRPAVSADIRGNASKWGRACPLRPQLVIRHHLACAKCALTYMTCDCGAGIFAMEPKGCVLRAGRKGVLSKVGEFCMVFAEHPNLSTIPWVRLLVGRAAFTAATVTLVDPGFSWGSLFVTHPPGNLCDKWGVCIITVC